MSILRTSEPPRAATLVTFVALEVLLRVPSARAEDLLPPPHRTTVRFQYTLGPGTKGCPTEHQFTSLVDKQTTFEVFAPDAPALLTVTIKRAGGSFVGRSEIDDPASPSRWVRPLPPNWDCLQLAEGLALTIATQIDPPILKPKPAPPPSIPPPPAPPSAPLAAPPPAPPAPSLAVRVGAGAALGLGVSPAAVAPGFTVDVGLRLLRWAPVSLALEARGYPSVTGPVVVDGARVTRERYTGALVPCGHLRVVAPVELAGCALVELGALQGTSDAVQPMPVAFFHAAAGLRGGVEVPLGDHLALRATGDALFNLRRDVARIYGRSAWEEPLVSAGFGFGAVALF